MVRTLFLGLCRASSVLFAKASLSFLVVSVRTERYWELLGWWLSPELFRLFIPQGSWRYKGSSFHSVEFSGAQKMEVRDKEEDPAFPLGP